MHIHNTETCFIDLIDVICLKCLKSDHPCPLDHHIIISDIVINHDTVQWFLKSSFILSTAVTHCHKQLTLGLCTYYPGDNDSTLFGPSSSSAKIIGHCKVDQSGGWTHSFSRMSDSEGTAAWVIAVSVIGGVLLFLVLLYLIR